MNNDNKIEYLRQLQKYYNAKGNEYIEKARNAKNDYERDCNDAHALECYGIANGISKSIHIITYW